MKKKMEAKEQNTKQKTQNEMVEIKPNISVIIVYVNELNIRRQGILKQI